MAASGSARAQSGNPLALVVVPQVELGKAASGLQVEMLSGPTPNGRAALDSFDPDDTAASVTKAGRVTGYTLFYGDVRFGALRRASGLVDLGTSLDLFRTAAQAQAFAAKSLDDLMRVRGRNLDGVVLERSTTFPVPGLGPGAIGIRAVLRFGTKRVYSTYVDFRIDRLLAEAAVSRADSTNADAAAIAVARSLLRRSRLFETGKLSGLPEDLPRQQGAPRRPDGGPDLAAMAITAQDLQVKVPVTSQAYITDDNAVVSYEREFRPDARSGVIVFKNAISLVRTRPEAGGRLFILRSIFSSPEGIASLVGSLSSTAKNIKLDGVRSLGVGEESFAVSVSFTTRTGRARIVLAYLRRQKVIGTLELAGAAKSLNVDRVVPFAGTLDRRISRTLGQKPVLVA